ncbi:TPA: hypothetical protein ACYZ0L_004506, partial [Escherichia coli]
FWQRGHEGNCDHKRTLKANIIPLIQLIGGITAESLPAPSLAGGGHKNNRRQKQWFDADI